MTLGRLLLSGLLALAFGAEASDRQRELDYAAYLQSSVSIGHVVWLTSSEQRFLALFTEAEKNDNTNAVIVLHDQGEHPDRQPLIQGLRTVLPRHNWTTLAIQLPLREAGARADDYYGLFDEARGRIQAGIEFLRNNGAQNIALVGVGMGAEMAVYTLSLDPEALLALATISLPLPDSAMPQAKIGDFIKNIALPFLDVYAEFDLPDVTDTARQRRMLAKDNPVYRQVEINGENHAYRNDPDRVIKRVYSWLALDLDSN